MKKIILILVAFGLFLFLLSGKSKKDDQIVQKDTIFNGGWVEVVSGKFFKVAEGKEIEIFSGDKVDSGETLMTDSTGKVVIRFYDGSVLRAGPDTKFSLDKAIYNEKDGKIVIEAGLSSGSLWSKIIELATPDSLWKIKTSNTVATVRGTAFGVSVDDVGATEIVGSENTVGVEVVDPETGESLVDEPVIISSDTFIKISEEVVKEIRVNKETLAKGDLAEPKMREVASKMKEKLTPLKIDDKVKNKDWNKENEEKDKEIRNEVEEIKNRVKDNREEFKKNIKEKVEEKVRAIKENRKKIKETESKRLIEDDKKDEENKDDPQKDIKNEIEAIKPKIPETIIKKVEEATQINKVEPALKKWKSLKIETESKLTDITEGEIISFRAVLIGENGETEDVTMGAKWEVLGFVGIIEKPGSFMAKLGDSISEYGEGYGFVVATWENPETKEKLFGKTSEVHVKMRIDESSVLFEEMEVLLR